MNINLDTGLTSPHNISGDVSNEYNDTTPSEFIAFPSSERRLLIVEPKVMLVVTGYNLNSATKISFRKVLRSNGVPAQGTSGCCPSVSVAHSVRLHSVELPCWELNKNNPIFVIKTPGSYEFDVVGDPADVVVTAVAFPIQEVNDIKCSPRLSELTL